MKNVVMVIPTYNEVGNVKKLVTALAPIFKSLSAYKMQALIVDDSSPDGTAGVIRELMFRYRWLHILLNKRKGGLGHAYKKGMMYAIDRLKADILFEFDADLQHDPSKIPAMLAALENGADFAIGSRYIKGGGIPKNWGLHRKFFSVWGNIFIRTVMANFKVHDWTSGYRAIKRQVVEAVIPELHAKQFTGYTWQIGFLHKAIALGYRVAEVPFVFRDRTSGVSKIGPEYIINNMAYIFKVRFQDILKSRIFKFVMVGGLGALIQLVTLQIWRLVVPKGISYGLLTSFQIAFFLAIETSIVSNFTWSNLWTFADRKLKASQIPGKFVAFNLTSGGSILIQQVIAILGERFIGLFPLFTIPVLNRSLDTGTMYAVTGIFIGMFWNFFAYSRIIWKKR